MKIENFKNTYTLSSIISKDILLQKDGLEFRALCPFHEEKSPSFTVNDSGKPPLYKPFFHCFGCGKHGDLFDWFLLYHNQTVSQAKKSLNGELFVKSVPNKELREKRPCWKPIFPIPENQELPTVVWNPKRGRWYKINASDIYTYTDGFDNTLGYVALCIMPDGKKWTPQITYCTDGKENRWCLTSMGDFRPPYNLYDIYNDNSNNVCIVVEGEKCADALASALNYKYTVTTWCGGADSWNKTDWGQLEHRKNIIIWPDNDIIGYYAAYEIKNLLPQARIINVPNSYPDKWDCANAIEDGWTVENLKEFIGIL